MRSRATASFRKGGMWSPRRGGLVVACLAVGAALAAGSSSAAPSPSTDAQAYQIGSDAYVYGIDILEFLRQQQTDTSVTVPNKFADAPTNQLGNQRELSTPSNQNQLIEGSSNSTLYSSAHLNLTRGPLVLHVPPVPGHRYYSFEFMDPYLNVLNYVGTRATGSGAGTYVIVGPKFRGRLPTHLHGLRLHRITAAYQRVWILARTHVHGASDLAAANTVQDGYKLIPWSAFKRAGLRYRPHRPHKVITTATPASIPTGLAFYDALGDALAQNPPPSRDGPILREMAAVGIGPGKHPSNENLPPATAQGLEAAVAAGPGHIRQLQVQYGFSDALHNHGWWTLAPDLGAWGTDYGMRAVCAVNCIAANLRAEAMYLGGVIDDTDTPLNGSESYRMHFAPDQIPPAKYFWSLTIYDYNSQLIANKYNRYSVGTNSPLVFNKDGSLDIYAQPTPPAGHEANWLPSPPSMVYLLAMRIYGPTAAAIAGNYHPPSIQHLLPGSIGL